jgi:hypothetical protein
VDLTEPFPCLGGPIKSRVTNTAAARNASRLVLCSRLGFFVDTVLRIYTAAEWINLLIAGYARGGHIFYVTSLIQVLMGFSLLLDVRHLLEADRDRKAKIFWMCGANTSLFGWAYMKLKFLIMVQSFGFILHFSYFDAKLVKELNDEIEESGEIVLLINVETWYACASMHVSKHSRPPSLETLLKSLLPRSPSLC